MPSAYDSLSRPAEIGVFDSGVGGLNVLTELRGQLPSASLRYFADTAYAPYGPRSPEAIRARSFVICEHLIAQGARLIVLACNTATAHAIDALRARWPDLPFVGTEPGIKPAVAASRNGRIGVLVTSSTAASERYLSLIRRHAAGREVWTQACPGLVELIEAGDLSSPALAARVEALTAPLRDAGVDTVLLGCTHYPFIDSLWRKALGPEVQVLRIETAVARQAARLWQGPASEPARLEIETSGSAPALQAWMAEVLDWPDCPVRHRAPESQTASMR